MYSKLSHEEIHKLNPCGTIGSKIYFYEELSSTFDKIKSLPLSDGLTVVCSRQTNGSGRLGRTWESPEGGLYFSFALMPPFNSFDIPFITIACALGVCNALSVYVPCSIKWPNDIVCSGKKLCGILTRNQVSLGKIEAVLVGIGINVNNTVFTDELCHADSLARIAGRRLNENLILKEVMEQIDHVYSKLSPGEILTQYKDKCVNLQKEVTIHYPDGRDDIKGVCTDILSDGSMNVSADGKDINVHSGEVSVKGIYSNQQ